ncbi:type IV secretory system conjugative DNA transfer family protein [Streptomyces chryseus]|uniref:type IV secretory system conjugative DNA transfer family protein n=1 Tax=Streptomyces chryseus TaxID=68186 RepID=UPI00110FCC96|nr:TraM recognition domain-containing protein [Streptomyces chryseus]GGX36591.1 hypothetical protein GCM10010353_59630 [Streptomyces chryseus]
MSSTNKKRGPGSDLTPYLSLGSSLLVLALVALVWSSAAAGAALSAHPAPPKNPFTLVFGLLSGDYTWPGLWATVVLAAETLVLGTVATAVLRAVLRGRKKRQTIDRAATHMGKGRDLARISETGARATAARLGAEGRSPGLFIGHTVVGHQPLYGTVEDTHLAIWGPRTGKTTRLAIPALMDHGSSPAFGTTNRRDLVDATRGPRAALGRVWVFDLQQIVGEDATWWWNPLTYVTGVATAAKLAGHFASDTRPANSSSDAHFEPTGQELLANFLLAAALAKRPITQVYRWLSDQKDMEPEKILRAAGPDFELAADSVRGMLTTADKERSGVYSTARRMATCLRNPSVTRWVTPAAAGDDTRPQFDPAAFVRSSDTIYLVSREGSDSAGALITALTVAICEAAEQYAMRSPGGRLPRELLGVLDEAANVCRWADLPDLYSHYGSRGIELLTILQSWSQGVKVWGEDGMRKLWSSANIATYGGGVRETQFLGDLSSLIGEFEALTRSVSYQPSRGGGGLLSSNRSTSLSTRSERIMDARDLVAVGSGRAIVLASQTPPTLVKTVGWWEREWADAVRASLDEYEPKGATDSDPQERV